MQTAGPTDISCRELVELVTDYVEDALPAPERARFEAHVAGCAGCEAYLAQMRITIDVVRAGKGIESPPDVPALVQVFREWGRALRES
jgi:anti-sigma factor RsiW